jgi:hypothetical protein
LKRKFLLISKFLNKKGSSEELGGFKINRIFY